MGDEMLWVCMYVCMHVCMHACMYVYAYIYICTGHRRNPDEGSMLRACGLDARPAANEHGSSQRVLDEGSVLVVWQGAHLHFHLTVISLGILFCFYYNIAIIRN